MDMHLGLSSYEVMFRLVVLWRVLRPVKSSGERGLTTYRKLLAGPYWRVIDLGSAVVLAEGRRNIARLIRPFRAGRKANHSVRTQRGSGLPSSS